ncbi:solute carrier organic anion transporter family member 2A1-like isoform X2 [Antedon mediterranea]|uniref:solute carrier organic anion transporter family member 2A1-like isoform X2 n=1 Tax=Antedon mediterranea TaxID=105859 RepID=UPI003AF6F09D
MKISRRMRGVIIFSIIVGSLSSCVCISIFKPKSVVLTRALLVLSILGVLIPLSIMLTTGCQNPEIVGLTDDIHCGCMCPSNTYSPVCGSNLITYITPCHAGCQSAEFNSNENKMMFTECSCATGLNQTSQNSVVVDGECDWNCDLTLPFTFSIASIFFMESAKINLMILLSVRVVKSEDRTYTLGFGTFQMILLGFFPTLLYLPVIDNAMCLLHESVSDVQTCAVYDKSLYRIVFYSLVIAFNVIGVLLLCFAFTKLPRNRFNQKDSNMWHSLRSRGSDSILRRNNVNDDFEYYSPPQSVTTFTTNSPPDRLQLDVIRPN